MEVQYGVASKDPSGGRSTGTEVISLASLDSSQQVYLGNASYLFRDATGLQFEQQAGPGGQAAQSLPPAELPDWESSADAALKSLPLRAARQHVVKLLAWDLTRRAHVTAACTLFETLSCIVQSQSLLCKIQDVKDRVSLLLSCLAACRYTQQLINQRDVLLSEGDASGGEKGKRKKGKAKGPAIRDSPMQPSQAAVQEAKAAQVSMCRSLHTATCYTLSQASKEFSARLCKHRGMSPSKVDLTYVLCSYSYPCRLSSTSSSACAAACCPSPLSPPRTHTV